MDTNPVKVDTDGDLLPDGWEVIYNEFAVTHGNVLTLDYRAWPVGSEDV